MGVPTLHGHCCMNVKRGSYRSGSLGQKLIKKSAETGTIEQEKHLDSAEIMQN